MEGSHTTYIRNYHQRRRHLIVMRVYFQSAFNVIWLKSIRSVRSRHGVWVGVRPSLMKGSCLPLRDREVLASRTAKTNGSILSFELEVGIEPDEIRFMWFTGARVP